MATATAGLAILALTSLMPGRPEAATGDVLAEFDASATAGVPYCSVNTGIAFDGDSLILSCWYSNTLYFVDAADHTSNGSVTVPGLYGIGAIAYDAGRDRLWACSSDYTTVRLIDLSTGAFDPAIPSISTAGCIDGLAYDGTDDTLWSSHDAASSVQHYAVDGTLISSVAVLGKLGSCGNSGIAVGGEDLFLGNNGCSEIYRAPKDIGTSAHFATLGRRVEDMECDGITFEGSGAIWAQDAYDRILTAYEIGPGLCEFGGGAPAAAAEAFVARVRADGVPLDSGTLGHTVAAVGDDTSSEVHHVSVPDAAEISVGRTTSTAEESSDTATSATGTARVTDISLLDGLVTATAIEAVANADFDRESGEASVSSEGSRLAGLVIDGNPIDVPVEPNTTITIPDVATVVLREEISNTEEAASMRVNMIHVTSADGSTEVVVSSAFASAGPGSASGEPVEPVGPDVPNVPDPTAIPVPTGVPAVPPVGLPGAPAFAAGFEEGEPAWTTTGSWIVGPPPAGSTAHGGAGIAATGAGSYPDSDVAALTSPLIDMTSYDPDDASPLNPAADTRAMLTYHQRFSSETYYDCGVIQASTDDGATWATITPEEGYNYTGAYCAVGGGVPASFSGSGLDPDWTPYTLDLTGFAGERLSIRFLFRTDGSVTDSGWHVDDLNLELVPA